MFSKITSFAVLGIEAIEITVEAHISNGLPSFNIVGLPDKSVNESRQRVRAAIINSGFKFPMKRIIVNLSPADIRKEGAVYDLPIAIAVIAVSKQINLPEESMLDCSGFIGELSLNGDVKPVKGTIAMAERAIKINKKYLFIPNKNLKQLSILKGIDFIGAISFSEVLKTLINRDLLLKKKI